jgi:hypothetical protein
VSEEGHEGHVVQRGQGSPENKENNCISKRSCRQERKKAKEFVEVGKKEYIGLFTSH